VFICRTLAVTPLDFYHDLCYQQTKSSYIGYHDCYSPPFCLCLDRLTDRQTDRRTYDRVIAFTAMRHAVKKEPIRIQVSLTVCQPAVCIKCIEAYMCKVLSLSLSRSVIVYEKVQVSGTWNLKAIGLRRVIRSMQRSSSLGLCLCRALRLIGLYA